MADASACGIGPRHAPSGSRGSQDSISRSALRRVAVSMRTTCCPSGVGSKKSRVITSDFGQANLYCFLKGRQEKRTQRWDGPSFTSWRLRRLRALLFKKRLPIGERVHLYEEIARQDGNLFARFKALQRIDEFDGIILLGIVRTGQCSTASLAARLCLWSAKKDLLALLTDFARTSESAKEPLNIADV